MKKEFVNKEVGVLFSVILPTYNRENFIVEALDSVKAQTYRPIELIIIDDGSTDNTQEIIERWSQKNSEKDIFCIYYIYQENLGVSNARNFGIQQIKGEYVQFLDSDDRIYPDRFQRLVDTFERERCDFIQTGFEGFDAETGRIIQRTYGNPDESQVELIMKGRFWANTLRSALRVELVKRIEPWNIEMTCFEDREYMERAVLKAHKAVAIRDVLASARRGGSVQISDKLRSYEGRVWRIYCEQQVVNAVQNRSDISYASRQQFASRIYGLGFRSNARGWSDLGKMCGTLASEMKVELDRVGKRRRWVWRLGRGAGLVYEFVSKVKGLIRNQM